MSNGIHLLTIIAGLLAFMTACGGCGLGGENDGLILRHLPVWLWDESTSLTGSHEVYVIRDRSCWEQIVGAPQDWWMDYYFVRYEQMLDIDFETEMVILYYEYGCSEDIAIDRVVQSGDHLQVTVTWESPVLVCFAVFRLTDAVVVPRSDAEVESVLLSWITYQPGISFPYPPKSIPTTRIDGPCTQTAP